MINNFIILINKLIMWFSDRSDTSRGDDRCCTVRESGQSGEIRNL